MCHVCFLNVKKPDRWHSAIERLSHIKPSNMEHLAFNSPINKKNGIHAPNLNFSKVEKLWKSIL
jgi:hypothetical protein